MKFLKISLIALLIVSSFAACKKDKAVTVIKIEGKWSGTTTLTSSGTTTALTFNLAADKSITVTNANGDPVSTSGSWELIDNALTIHYVNVNFEYYYKGTFDSSAGKLDGTYGSTVEATNYGTWSMTKSK